MRGLYKVEYQMGEGRGRSVMYARDGKLLGGNSAFAHVGTFETLPDGTLTAEIATLRHNPDPSYKLLLTSDDTVLAVRGVADGDILRFEGGTPDMPGVVFRSVMKPLDEATSPPPGIVAEGGMVNGLYSNHIQMLDGIGGGIPG